MSRACLGLGLIAAAVGPACLIGVVDGASIFKGGAMRKPAVRSLLALAVGALCCGWDEPASAADAKAPADTPLAAQADALMAALYGPDEPGAVLLVMKDGEVLVRRAYGLADLELGVKLEPDMVFRIGSMTKQFTAVAVLMLAEQGKLGLADPITRLLPDYPTRGRTITVGHLLTHTSGIPSFTGLPAWQTLARVDMTPGELIDGFKDEPLEFEPGERWKYSNSGYVLLGAIIEKVSGLSYEAFLQGKVFDPLGMKHTYCESASRVIPRRVRGYGAKPDGTFVNAEYISMTQPYAAGGLLSNVDDLATWYQALRQGRLIKRETLERAWTAHVLPDGSSTGYSYGWSIGERAGRRMVRHDGDIAGFAADGLLFPEEDLWIAILTNSEVDERRPGPLASRIAALALGIANGRRKAVSIDLALLDRYAGEYELGPGFTVRFYREGTRFLSQGTGEPAVEIFPESETRFFSEASEATVEFVRDEVGTVTGYVLTLNGRTLHAKRIAN